MERPENRLDRLAERLAERRRLERLRVVAGLLVGAIAGFVNAVAGQLGLYAALVLLAAGFYLVDRVARRSPEYSLLRGLASFLPSYTLSWLCFYAAFIQ